MDEKIKALYAAAVQKIKDLWNKNKIVFFIVVPLLILAKFRDIIIDILLSSGKRILSNTKEKDEALKSQAEDANSQANKLIDDAKKKAEEKPNADEDWYKK